MINFGYPFTLLMGRGRYSEVCDAWDVEQGDADALKIIVYFFVFSADTA